METESDLIEKLYERGLQHVVDQIFEYLDCFCVRRAEMVSAVWRDILLEGKIWKTLLRRNVRHSQRWSDTLLALNGVTDVTLDLQETSPAHYRKVCCAIDVKLQVLESNWKTATYSECNIDFGPFCDSPFLYDSDFFDMNGNWIVRVQQNERTIVVRNRWTLDIEDILEIPCAQIQFNGVAPIVNSVKINDNFIVVSFCQHPEICVWNTSTRTLLYVLNADSLGIKQREGNDGDYQMFPAYRPSLWKNLLLLCHTRPTDVLLNCTSWTITLRCLSSNVSETGTLLHKTVIRGWPRFLCGLYVDNMYTVLCYLEFNTGSGKFIVEIRNTTSFEITSNITFYTENIPVGYHYSNGLIVTHQGNSFRLWDVGKGEQLSTVVQQGNITSIRLVSNRYVVSCDYSCTVKIWDLQTALTSHSTPNAVRLIQEIPPPARPRPHERLALSLAVDEFQIAVVAQCNRQSYSLNVKDFFNGAH